MTQPFQFANGQLAHNAEDLLELCQKFPTDGINHLVREDLEKWLAYIGQNDIAQCAASARQTPLEDRQKLEEFLAKCHALSSPEIESETKPEPTPIAEPTPVVKANPTVSKPESNNSVDRDNTKPSFLQVIARLIINVLYRNKN